LKIFNPGMKASRTRTKSAPELVPGNTPLEDLKADLAAVEKHHSATKRKAKAEKPAVKAEVPSRKDSSGPTHTSGKEPGNALAVLESRYPVTLAFESMIHRGVVTPESQEEWKSDLAQAVIEGAKKFFGFHNVNALRQALEVNLALLSLSLLIRTEGRPDLDAWVDVLGKTSVTDLLNESLTHIKGLAYGQEFLFPELGERPLRDVLLEIARARDPRHKNRWVGYEKFLQEQLNRKTQQATDKLARFLIELLLRKNPKAWLKSTATGSGANLEDIGSFVTAEEAINTLIFRYCILQTGQRIPENIDLTMEYIILTRKEYEANPKAWLATTSARFEQLLKLLSPPLRERLTQPRNWFETRLKSGPPKLSAKAARRKETSDDDDENPEMVDLPGISGIYCYQIYG
jgi:hypothetical protein